MKSLRPDLIACLALCMFGLTACGDAPPPPSHVVEKPAEQTSEQKFAATSKAAEQGHADAQTNLADLYDRGEGVPKDAAKAAEWWTKAAVQGHADAQYSLGRAYALGEGVPKDAAKAAEWWTKAAVQGNAFAQYSLARAYGLGEGVPKDAAKAAEWVTKAAVQGDVSAQTDLAGLYHRGEGVPKDAAKAAEWWTKAAVQGNADAQLGLGLSYFRGRGLPTDRVIAYAWVNLAGVSGYDKAISARVLIESVLSEAELQEAQRLASQWKPGQSIVRVGKAPTAAPPTSNGSTTLNKQGTGTAFVVSKTGLAITNYHVTAGCKELRIEGRDGTAKLVTDDKVNDLALLQISGAINTTAPIASEPQKLRQGQDIVVFGFPLNFVLSSGGNLTPGVVSALTGLGNNTSQIQITAPIQPGSSGSPVLNKKGEVVGVVSMKLSDKEMARTTGSVGQNANFAVNGQTLKAFLDTHRVEYRVAGINFFEKSNADLADEARKWSVVVECWK